MGQIAFFIGQLLDIVLVMRWNRVIGIPDVLPLDAAQHWGFRLRAGFRCEGLGSRPLKLSCEA